MLGLRPWVIVARANCTIPTQDKHFKQPNIMYQLVFVLREYTLLLLHSFAPPTCLVQILFSCSLFFTFTTLWLKASIFFHLCIIDHAPCMSFSKDCYLFLLLLKSVYLTVYLISLPWMMYCSERLPSVITVPQNRNRVIFQPYSSEHPFTMLIQLILWVTKSMCLISLRVKIYPIKFLSC